MRLEGKKRIRMSYFSATDPFLTTFYYVEKRNGILRRTRREGLKILRNLTWGKGVKNCQNHPCVINEWPLRGNDRENMDKRNTTMEINRRSVRKVSGLFVLKNPGGFQ